MQITVKTLKGQQFQLQVAPTDLVKALKERIHTECQQVEPELQKLIMQGTVLDNEKPLSEYGVKEGSLFILMALKAKPQPKAPQPPPSDQPQVMNNSQPAPQQQNPLNPPNAAPVPQSAGAPGAPPGPANPLLTGEAFENAVTEMQAMGFQRDEILRAMAAAYNYPERAIDYLMNGMPEEMQDEAQYHEQPQPGAHEPAEGNPLAFLAQQPLFTQVRERLLSDPSFFQSFMAQLAQQQPDIYQLITQHPQAFMQLLEQGDAGEEEEEGDPPGVVSVTQEEKDAIDRLTNMGFSRQRAIEAFLACDRNEEYAANYLFENAAEFAALDQEQPPAEGVPHEVAGYQEPVYEGAPYEEEEGLGGEEAEGELYSEEGPDEEEGEGVPAAAPSAEDIQLSNAIAASLAADLMAQQQQPPVNQQQQQQQPAPGNQEEGGGSGEKKDDEEGEGGGGSSLA